MQTSTQMQLAETLRRIETEHSERERFLLERLNSLENLLIESNSKYTELVNNYEMVLNQSKDLATKLETLTVNYKRTNLQMNALSKLLEGLNGK